MNAHWLTNPVNNPMAVRLVILIFIIFASAGLALLGLHLRRIALLCGGVTLPITLTAQNVLWQRYRTWVIIAILFVGATLAGPLAIAILCAFLCWQGGREYALLTSLPAGHRLLLICSGWLTLLTVLLAGPLPLAFTPVVAFFAWSMVILRPIDGETTVGERFRVGLFGFWGYLYLGWLPAYLLALSMESRSALVILVGLGVALSDVGAFCCGKMLGGPRLAPHLSPGKTWAGLLGNVLGAALALCLVSFALPPLQFWQLALLVAVIGLGSAWGDLLESLLKRQYGVKDAGELLPGFGGLLDRVDSLLFVAPFVYYTALFFLK
jgi:phosphatidate cytidylyltransferase